ncbi:hypothetical protein [Xanthomonas oryzae]|uniref:hypothetical protein n=1 Tax=Xanthomonas oryzae TaxID=347 RepID=UPI001249EEC6
MAMSALMSREPWWEKPPQPGKSELECVWGWLELYDDGTFRFDVSSRPSDQEIPTSQATSFVPLIVLAVAVKRSYELPATQHREKY